MSNSEDLPLTGIRVLELGQMIAVPAATHILRAYGAEVIKIEDTHTGDPLRFFGSKKNGMGAWYANANWGKKSLAIDLKSDEGSHLFWTLIDTADVLIEGFRTGVVDKLGFSYDAVSTRKPNIIYCSSSGFGREGPYAEQPCYDSMVQSLAGWAGNQKHDGEPQLIKGVVADKVGAYTNAHAILAALVKRGLTGKGSLVETNMLEASLAFVWPDVMMDCSLLDKDAEQLPNIVGGYRLYACKDGLVSISPAGDKHWKAICDALDPTQWEKEHLRTAAGRGARSKEYRDTIAAMTGSYSVAEVVQKLRAVQVPIAPAMDPHAVHTNEHIEATDMLEVTEHPVVGQIRHPRPISSFFNIENPLDPTPVHGQHTAELLSELGLSADQLSDLKEAGHIKQHENIV